MQHILGTPWRVAPLRWCSGLALAALGLGADLLAGWVMLGQGDLRGLALHLPAAVLWGVGILYLQPPSAGDRFSISGWTVAAFVIGLCSFPGLGTFSGSFAFGASYLLRRRTANIEDESDLLRSMALPVVMGKSVEVLRMQDIQPLVDVLHVQNTELRRVVVKALGDQGDQDSVKLIRSMLADPSPDVRSDAAVILTRLERDHSEAIQEAIDHVRFTPDDPERQLDLARLCVRYAKNGLLDAVSSQYYLQQACDILVALANRAPCRTDIWVDLARVQQALFHAPAALAALDHVLAQRPDHNDAYLLSVEIAFSEQHWERLMRLAQERRPVPEETLALLRWWAALHPVDLGGTWHG